MKRIKILALIAVLCLTLTSCGGNTASGGPEESEEPNQSVAPQESDSLKTEEEPQEEFPDIGSVEVDENLLTVDITIPASMFEGEDMSAFDTEAYVAKQGFNKAVVNDDGSVTVTMTKAKHKELMAETMAEIDSSFSSMVEAEDTPYIKEIKHADDFSTIDIIVDKAGYEADGLMSAFIPMMVYMQGAVYQIFNGGEQRSEISFVDFAKGDVLNSVVYPDALLEE